MTVLSSQASNGGQRETKQHSHLHHRGEYWNILSVYNGNHDGVVKSSWAFPESCAAMKVEASAQTMMANGKTKALITPSPR